MIKPSQFFLSALIAILMPSLVLADDAGNNPSLTKTWIFDAGAVFQNLDGDVSATTAAGGGGSYDLGRLGLDNTNTSLLLGMRWRFADRWRLDLAFDNVDTDGSRANNSTIEFGRITIPKGYEIDSSVELRTYSGFIGYAFSKDSRHELGARIGLNVIDAKASVGGRAWLGQTEVSVGPEYVNITQVVPTLGLYAVVALTDRLALEGSVDAVGGRIGDMSGHYVAVAGAISYWLTDKVAIGAGYRFVDAKVERNGRSIDEGVDVRSSGPFVKATVGF